MRVRLLAPLLAFSLLAAPSEYRTRRDELRKSLNDGVLVLFGTTEKQAGDATGGFAQEPNFYYLTGWKQPGAILLVDGERETLFIPKRNEVQERWTGRKVAPGDPNAASATGFENILPVERFESELRASLERYGRIFALAGPERDKLAALAPLRDIAPAAPMLARMRMKKSAGEMALIERAIDATIEAHRAGWKRAAGGLYEYQVAAAMAAVYLDRGCEGPAYAPIVGSGPNSTVLHYSANSRRLDQGEVLLMDVGAECSGYAADITRTIPVGGRFTPRQRELYEIVLGAEKAVIAAVKPGATLGRNTPNSLYRVAYDYIDSHGKDLHGNSLGRYFTHGISHHIGLEVHDAGDVSAPLEPGMVISVEPGIYIPEESIGIRIEDMVLVTGDGGRVLTGALPKEPGEVEKAVSGR
jgi:Xaa-Pro aminopeptidase